MNLKFYTLRNISYVNVFVKSHLNGVHSNEMMTVRPNKQKRSEARKTNTKNKHKYCCGVH